MRRLPTNLLLLITALTGIISSACTSGGVGDPCIPEDEYKKNFSGYAETEVNVESRSFQCETRVCLVANFRGRVSCPYGQIDNGKVDPNTGLPEVDSNLTPDDRCYLPGTKATDNNAIAVPVPAQLLARPPDKAVYCSCRCDGPDRNVQYCECPSGYVCQKLVDAYGTQGGAQLAGSYCIKDGTQVNDPTKLTNTPPCSPMNVAARPNGCGTSKHPTGIQ